MNPLNNPLEGFAPDLYLATLSEVAHSDGLHPIEEELLRQQAANFGLSLDDLPTVPRDLSDLPWTTRIVVYRDALMLAYADAETLSPQEQQYLADLARRMGLPAARTDAIAAWTKDYGDVLDRFGLLLQPA